VTDDPKKPRRVRNVGVGPRAFVKCPFCDYGGIHLGNACRWCAKCFTRYEVKGRWVVFDPGMGPRSEGEAWAIAIAKAGGMRIGARESQEKKP